MRTLQVAALQTTIHWEDSGANLSMYDKKLSLIKPDTDVIILPEMFTTGFSMNPEKLAENMEGKTVQWMKKAAKNLSSSICGSIIIEENKVYTNRFINITPDEKITWYDKRHLFRMGNEQQHYQSGKKRLTYTIGDWRIFPLICYDLRFPVWSRNQNEYDLLIYVANWPEARREVWRKLLLARAIENQCYVIGVNRIGEDGTGITYSGDTMIIDPRGNIMSEARKYEEEIVHAEISLDELEEFRKKFPVMLDADQFTIL